MRRGVAWLLIAALTAGCAQPPPPATPATVAADEGPWPWVGVDEASCVGLAAAPRDRTAQTEIPAAKTTGEAIGAGAAQGAKASLETGTQVGGRILYEGMGAGSAHPVAGLGLAVAGAAAVLAGVVMAPVAAVVGAVGGAASGVSQEERDRGLAAMTRAIESFEPGPMIVAAIRAEPCRPRLVACPEAGPCTVPDGERPAAILVIRPLPPRFAAEEAIDPVLTLTLAVEISARDAAGADLGQRQVERAGAPAPFTRMAADDAALLHRQLDELAAALGHEIVRRYLALPPDADAAGAR